MIWTYVCIWIITTDYWAIFIPRDCIYWSDPVPGNIAEQENQNDHQKHEGEMILAILGNKTLKVLYNENRGSKKVSFDWQG